MNVPGSNLLNLALSVIQKQAMVYSKYTSRSLAANGMYVSTYANGVTVYGSFQPIARNLFSQMGLDLQKSYATIYLSKDVLDVTRNVAGDKFSFAGKNWQVESKTDWFAVDGWDAVLVVQIP